MRRLRRSVDGRRRSRVALAYSIGLLRPLGAIIARTDGLSVGLSSGEDVSRVHPVYCWRDLAGFVHVTAANTAGPVVLNFLERDLKLLLKTQPFTPVQLTPDPFTTRQNLETMLRKGLLPGAWDMV